ncbi:hypothetical protein K6T82_14170 [Flavobacterium sp. 17A]|uniref:Uncharacterized protein n=1 Tax=Flavobacterium potami TaxID=2872310 RepID=A0A9X1KQY6_9FLAO|nr:hypothetical protein [Flavobacterium potami]MBZ4035919.1 hypothetical protein [Flavobacterium potami]
MITILEYLFIVRFRKLVSKGDSLAILLVVLLYLVAAFLVFKNYEHFRNYIFLFFLDVVGYHLQRSDIEILRLRKDYKIILFLEYLIYSLPFHLVLLFKEEYLYIVAVLVFNIFLINLPKSNFKTIKYPFNLFNVYWHINFRKYKLIYLFPFLAVLIYVATEYKNQNLIYFVLLVLSLLACMTSFEREQTEEIRRNPFSAEKYLRYQLKNTLVNTFYITIPIVIVLCFLGRWEELMLIGIVFILPLANVVLKYMYFKNSLIHQIVFVLYTSSIITLFGVPLIVMPFMYKKAVKNLNTIKYAED